MPYVVLRVIENARHTAICNRLNSNARSVGIIVDNGIITWLLCNFPVRTDASITLWATMMFGNMVLWVAPWGRWIDKSQWKILWGHLSTWIFPMPMSNNFFENTSADWSYCNATCIFVVSSNVCILCHKWDDFEHALSLSAGVYLGMRSSILFKSPDSTIIFVFKSFRLRSGADFAGLQQSGFLEIVLRQNINEMINVLPVSLGALRKKIAPFPTSATFIRTPYALLCCGWGIRLFGAGINNFLNKFPHCSKHISSIKMGATLCISSLIGSSKLEVEIRTLWKISPNITPLNAFQKSYGLDGKHVDNDGIQCPNLICWRWLSLHIFYIIFKYRFLHRTAKP